MILTQIRHRIESVSLRNLIQSQIIQWQTEKTRNNLHKENDQLQTKCLLKNLQLKLVEIGLLIYLRNTSMLLRLFPF